MLNEILTTLSIVKLLRELLPELWRLASRLLTALAKFYRRPVVFDPIACGGGVIGGVATVNVILPDGTLRHVQG